MLKLKKAHLISLVLLPCVPVTFLMSSSLLAQDSATEDEWANLPFEQQFVDGCVKGGNQSTEQLQSKKEFCQCAFDAYKDRYSPQVFSQINALAVQSGEPGNQLVSLMMKPELDHCSELSGYSRS